MARFRLALVLLVAAGGCSSHRESKHESHSKPRDAGEDDEQPAGRGAAGRIASAPAGGARSEARDAGMPQAERDADTQGVERDAGMQTGEQDPCAGLRNACDAPGTSCSGTTLVTCAKNADGCLVAAREDCTRVSGKNACGGDPAECQRDPCRNAQGAPKSEVCATPHDSCAGDYWVHCVPDDDGCPIATRTNCTEQSGKNMCDAMADPPACGFDPCKGVTNCLHAGKSCDGVKLIECAANADGCLVTSTTDCTQNQTMPLTCDAASGTAACTTCSDAAGCAGKADGDTLCDGNVFQSCSDTDGDTCLNAVREDCGESFACDPDPAKRCVYSGDDQCSSEITASLREPMSYGPFDSTDAGNDYSGYTCPGLFFGVQATSPDLLFAVDVAPKSVVSVGLSAPEGWSGNGPQLLVLTRCADDPDDNARSAEASCQSASTTAVVYTNQTNSSERIYVVVDANRANNADSPENVGTFGLTLDSRPYRCGDGKRDGAEACDDGNIVSGDGCTPSCTRETGFNCTSSSPSICTRRPSDGICANVRCPALPSDAPANSQTCCTQDQRCGIAYSLVFGASCLARDQPGTADESCPDAQSVFPPFIPNLKGCCRPDGKCGLAAADGGGCVEREEAWAAMTDGLGDFLYPGPFESVTCSYE
jgi:cysteine-rich repeat protein